MSSEEEFRDFLETECFIVRLARDARVKTLCISAVNASGLEVFHGLLGGRTSLFHPAQKQVALFFYDEEQANLMHDEFFIRRKSDNHRNVPIIFHGAPE